MTLFCRGPRAARSSRFAPVAVFACAALLQYGSANAGFINFYDGGGPVQPDENVLLAKNITGETFTAETNKGTTVLLSQPHFAEELINTASGQAVIESNSTDKLFTSLRVSLTAGSFFTSFEANPIFAIVPLTFRVGAFDNNNVLQTHEFTSANGQNFFGIETGDGWKMQYVEIFGLDGNGLVKENAIKEVKQIRISGVTGPENQVLAPEPASLALLALGSVGLGGFGLRRRKSVNRSTVA